MRWQQFAGMVGVDVEQSSCSLPLEIAWWSGDFEDPAGTGESVACYEMSRQAISAGTHRWKAGGEHSFSGTPGRLARGVFLTLLVYRLPGSRRPLLPSGTVDLVIAAAAGIVEQARVAARLSPSGSRSGADLITQLERDDSEVNGEAHIETGSAPPWGDLSAQVIVDPRFLPEDVPARNGVLWFAGRSHARGEDFSVAAESEPSEVAVQLRVRWRPGEQGDPEQLRGLLGIHGPPRATRVGRVGEGIW